METLATAPCKDKPDPLEKICSEVNRDAYVKIEAVVSKDNRSRSFVVRQIVHAWAAMSHKDRMAALRNGP